MLTNLALKPDEAATATLTQEVKLKQRFALFLRASVTYLVEANFRGCNLVKHGGRFYGLSLSVGAVDLSRTPDAVLEDLQQRHLCFIADDMTGLKKQIDGSGFRASPELIEQNYHGF